MQGMMMHRPLAIIDILKFAAESYPTGEIVSRRVEGDVHRYTYPEAYARAGQLAHALAALGVAEGDRVATLAWNGYRHFELYYAVSGMGAVCHTINPRLPAEQLAYIMHHAEDRLLFVDATFVPLVEAMAAELPAGLRVVVMTDRAHMPESALDLLCYEELLEGRPETYDWPELDENTAGPGSATPPGPPATPRARSTRTVRRCCTPSRWRWRSARRCGRGGACCRWCRSFTSTPGGCPMPRRSPARASSFRAPRSTGRRSST